MEPEPSPKPVRWYLSVPAVLFALVLLGPLGFPMLWKSPAFNLFWKIVLTIAMTVATVYLLLGTWKMVDYILREFRNLAAV